MTTLPLTMSSELSVKGASWANDKGVNLQIALGLDFHDVHPYYNVTYPLAAGSVYATGSDAAALESMAGYLGSFFIGEIGVGYNGNAASVTALMNGLGDLTRRPTCQGLNYLGLTDYFTTAPFGLYPDNTPFVTTSTRSNLVTPLQAFLEAG